MDRRLKVVILGGFLVCVTAITFSSLQNPKPKSLPDFLVSDVDGKVEKGWLKLSFNIENNGTQIAKNVSGTASFEKSGGGWATADWYFHGDFETTLEIGERRPCRATFWHFTTMPSKNFAIFVFCDQGVTRRFNVTIT